MTEPKIYDTKDGQQTECKACGAPIVFVITERARRMPCNPDGSPHWGNCTNPDRFRKEKRHV